MIKEQELKERRKNGWRFENLSEYNPILQEIFQEEGVPLIIGGYNLEPRKLELRRNILPLTKLDELRVRNFCAGVDSLEKCLISGRYQTKNSSEFLARIDLGVEDITRCRIGESFLNTGFNLDGIYYNLNLTLEENYPVRKIVYKSKIEMEMPESLKILSHFIGPDFNLSNKEIYKK